MFTRNAFMAAFLLAPPAFHAQVVGGTIAGTVTDASGASLPNATVILRNDETGNQRRLVTDDGGSFSAPTSTVGSYTATATHEGFTPAVRRGISVSVGQSVRIELVLAAGAVTQEVTVTDTASVVNSTTEQTAGQVNERQIKELPLNGRSYDQLVTLNAGVVNYTAQRSGSVGTSNSSVGNMFVVSGRRPQDNLYLLNGIEYTGASLINVTPGGTSGQLLGVEAVREFNMLPDTYGANYGKRQGAQISIVTGSGTNVLHGSAYEFLRNSYFDARNYFDQARLPEFQRNDFGGSLGGPIQRNRLFLFGNYEGYRQNLGITAVTLVPNAASRAAAAPSVKPFLNLWPVANGPDLGNGIAEAFSSPMQHIREDFGTTRADLNAGANDLLFAVYTVDDSTADTPTQNPLSRIREGLREQVLSLQEQHVFSSHLINTFRVGFSRASFYFQGSIPNDVQAATPTFVAGKPTGAIVIAGSTASNGSSQITGAGANVGSNNATARNLYTLDDHIFYTHGRHQIELGAWLQRLQSNDNLAQNQFGQASFASLTSFLAGTVKTFTVVPSPTKLAWRSLFSAVYAEDTWKPTPRLEIRGGLRSESTTGWNEAHGRAAVYGFTPSPISGALPVINTNPTTGSSGLTQNRAKFLPEPRVGLAWNAFGSGSTAVTASFGLHHSLLDNLDYRFDQSAPYNTTVAYSNTPIANPANGAQGLVSPSNVQPDIATPTVLAWTLKVEQKIAPATSLTVGYVGSRGYHQILSEDQNEPNAVVCSANVSCPAGIPNGTIYYPTAAKANPAVANTTSWVSQGSSNYNALEVDVRRMLSHGVQFRANYTFAKNLDNGSAWNTSVSANTPAYVSYPANPGLDYGPAATDIRHLASINATYDLPFGTDRAFLSDSTPVVRRAVSGWTLASIASLQSGFPFSPQLGYNPTGSGDTRNPVRPDRNRNFIGALYTSGSTSQRVARYFNPAAFSAPAAGTVGNLGRDTLTGPGYADWDVSLLKATQLAESLRLQFRAEFFNVLNHTNLQTPNEVVFSAGPSQGSVANQTTSVVRSPTAGLITSAASSRQIQLGLRLLF